MISLGLIPDSDRKVVQVLEKYFEENRKREEIICAHVPNAIARILKDAPVDERKTYCDKLVVELAEKAKSSEANIRRSMAQALGMLTRAEDPQAKKVFEVLQEKIEEGALEEHPTRLFRNDCSRPDLRHRRSGQ